MPFQRSLSVLLICCLFLGDLHAEGTAETEDHADTPLSPYSLRHSPDRPRSLFWPQFTSLLLPGFDQWWEEQNDYALSYTGLAGGGLAYALAAENVGDKRHVGLGVQAFSAAGGYSAFHSFRSAVKSRRGQGDFGFLEIEEPPSEIFFAPFRLDYLGRVTTLIPVLTAAVLVAIGQIDFSGLTGSDVFFSGATSYFAGTWEECAFRGWLMPLTMHYMDNRYVANFLTCLLFGAAHYNGTFIPWPQFLLGLYVGEVSQRNQWTLSESIFIHSWWDVILLSAEYSRQRGETYVALPRLYLVF